MWMDKIYFGRSRIQHQDDGWSDLEITPWFPFRKQLIKKTVTLLLILYVEKFVDAQYQK